MASIEPSTLYYGDCLDWMEQWPDRSVDLIYLDPPFNSNQDYSVLFGGAEGNGAQYRAFSDTWKWDDAASDRLDSMLGAVARPSHRTIKGLHGILGRSGMLAYLTYMAERLEHMRRILKPTGSIYLHCDPTASHYLKLVMDGIFGKACFRAEITWRRTNAKGLSHRSFPNNSDVLLYYSRTKKFVWHSQYRPLSKGYERKFYRYIEPGTKRKYRLSDLTNPNKNRPNLTYEFLGVKRVWRWTKERMQKAYEAGLVLQSKPGGGAKVETLP